MTDIPTFMVTADYDIGQVIIGLEKKEWEHMDDHDEVLVRLEPLAVQYLYQKLLERTLDALRAGIHAQFHHWVQSGALFRLFHGKWVWEELEQERQKERRAKWP